MTCVDVAVILLEGGTEFDLQILSAAADGQLQINRLVARRIGFFFRFVSVVSFRLLVL